MKPIDVELSRVSELLGKKCRYPNKDTGRINTGVITGILDKSFTIRDRSGVTVKSAWVAVEVVET
jgi:hypothetical protein